ncbi:DUF2059 domain-containing protein [Hydrogenophaga laconesensis]|uniref:DUF2059 domain-containing protein n=1 Tax=Hydrogenophaga laconesensis TaxID=1805971 RepID=A0ABU1VAW1_9BURK|nr:DUF2059 domain-containing protein [Hydrogenophaga laconesensis]MDR7094348.1 hypothetical protein [Hydrogenophaga laconesensis]
MKQTLAAALLGSMVSLTAHAAPPSDASIATLLSVTQSDKMLDTMYANMEQMIRQGMQQATAGKALSDEQKRVMELAPTRIARLMREEITWASMEPMIVQVYRESFDQAEIDGLIAFYQSPVGQSFVAKMPLVMQRSMDASQAQLQAFMPKLQQAMAEVMKEARLTP